MSDDVIAPPAIDLALARKVLQTEAAAIQALVDRLGESFERAVRLLLDCRGRVIVTGMGKSGIICRKIAATLSSTGTPAFFINTGEAIHGDLDWERVESIKSRGREMTYDLSVPEHHTFVANDIVTHNTIDRKSTRLNSSH